MKNILTGLSFGIVKEGIPFIFFFVFCSLIFALINFRILALLFLILTFFVMNFFRDPERYPPDGKNIVISPADGKVVDIKKVPDPINGLEKTRISIFMNVFNVHVNRSPVSGEVKKIKYIPGRFFNASLDKSSEKNERNLIVISSGNQEFTVVQIAGLIARRIVCWIKEGERVTIGQRIGMIKFGSRVDLYLAPGYEIIVSRGEKVIAGQTILAKKEGN
ncbi:phosphatidylserine decarboxylase family protein [Desulfothermus okinawensis JCM 13304]